MGRSAPVGKPVEPLADGVVAVRPRTASDVDAIAAASHDPQTRRWLDDPPMDEDARRTSLAQTEQAWQSGTSAPLVIADVATDEPIGLVNLQFRDDNITTIAYSVFPARRGQGIAPRAVRPVTEWAFRDLGVGQLVLAADSANTASLRVAEKCQFQRTGSRTETNDDHHERTVVVFTRWRQ